MVVILDKQQRKNKANFNKNKSSIKDLIASMQNPDSLMQWMFLDRVLSLIDVLFFFLLFTFLSLALKAKFHNCSDTLYVYSKPQELDKPQEGSSTTCIYLWNCFCWMVTVIWIWCYQFWFCVVLSHLQVILVLVKSGSWSQIFENVALELTSF